MNKKQKIIAIVPPRRKKDGTGHEQRMRDLRHFLLRHHPDIIFLIFPYDKVLPNKADILLLDARDRNFPQEITAKVKVAIDNQGNARKIADVIYDTLPHPSMSIRDQKKALRHFLLSPFFVRCQYQRKKVFVSQVQNLALSKILRTHNKASLVQGINYQKPKRFRQKLVSASHFYTYFGQSFFEAFFLGKQIFLYNITPVHEPLNQLAVQNYHRWDLDGRGMFRAVKLLAKCLR